MAEKEYIEREEIIKRIKLRMGDYSRDCNSFAPKMVLAYKELLNMVEYLPTADVQEVRHGKWRKVQNYALCTCCKHEVNWCNDDYLSPYCPNCGTKMDKE